MALNPKSAERLAKIIEQRAAEQAPEIFMRKFITQPILKLAEKFSETRVGQKFGNWLFDRTMNSKTFETAVKANQKIVEMQESLQKATEPAQEALLKGAEKIALLKTDWSKTIERDSGELKR